MSLCFKPASWCLLFSQVNLRQEIAQSFLSTAKLITKYSLEHFLSICSEKIYLKAF